MDKDAYPEVPRELLRRPRRNKRQEQIDELVRLLEKVEFKLSKSPEFNTWDLGPSDLLTEVRNAIKANRK